MYLPFSKINAPERYAALVLDLWYPLAYLYIHQLTCKPFVIHTSTYFISSTWFDKYHECHKYRHLIIHSLAPLSSNELL